jgi:hypothetical protein
MAPTSLFISRIMLLNDIAQEDSAPIQFAPEIAQETARARRLLGSHHAGRRDHARFLGPGRARTMIGNLQTVTPGAILPRENSRERLDREGKDQRSLCTKSELCSNLYALGRKFVHTGIIIQRSISVRRRRFRVPRKR